MQRKSYGGLIIEENMTEKLSVKTALEMGIIGLETNFCKVRLRRDPLVFFIALNLTFALGIP